MFCAFIFGNSNRITKSYGVKPTTQTNCIISMKKLWMLLPLVFALLYAQTQPPLLGQNNIRRNSINKTGMVVLGSWATANIVTGAIAAGNSTGQTKYFYRMNTYWNAVNISLAGFGYLNARRAKNDQNLSASLMEQSKVEKTFLFNTALDLAYVAGGLYLNERGKNFIKNRDRFKGFGNSIMLQGVFLLVFDAAMYGIHAGNGKGLYKLISNGNVAMSPGSISVRVQL